MAREVLGYPCWWYDMMMMMMMMITSSDVGSLFTLIYWITPEYIYIYIPTYFEHTLFLSLPLSPSLSLALFLTVSHKSCTYWIFLTPAFYEKTNFSSPESIALFSVHLVRSYQSQCVRTKFSTCSIHCYSLVTRPKTIWHVYIFWHCILVYVVFHH